MFGGGAFMGNVSGKGGDCQGNYILYKLKEGVKWHYIISEKYYIVDPKYEVEFKNKHRD